MNEFTTYELYLHISIGKINTKNFFEKANYFLGRSIIISSTETEETKTGIQRISYKIW